MSKVIPVAVAVAALAGALFVASCGQTVTKYPPAEAHKGNPERGRRLIAQYGCGSCHQVPGVTGADGLVGPPLTRFGRRSYIAGELPNTAPNLRRWIENPQQVEPGTAMPNLKVTPLDATDIAAYLLSLG